MYVYSVPAALNAWSPGFSLALAGCVSGQAQYPNTSVALPAKAEWHVIKHDGIVVRGACPCERLLIHDGDKS